MLGRQRTQHKPQQIQNHTGGLQDLTRPRYSCPDWGIVPVMLWEGGWDGWPSAQMFLPHLFERSFSPTAHLVQALFLFGTSATRIRILQADLGKGKRNSEVLSEDSSQESGFKLWFQVTCCTQLAAWFQRMAPARHCHFPLMPTRILQASLSSVWAHAGPLLRAAQCMHRARQRAGGSHFSSYGTSQ